jgi:hypothetical protein
VITKDTYAELAGKYRGADIITGIAAKLVSLWCDDYYFTNPSAELVEVDVGESATSFNYLFDIRLQRTIVAFGVPTFSQHRRDASRMAGHPLSAGSEFHRGHLMAHSIGGGMDINLVPQLGKLNIGEFRVLERMVRDLAKQSLRCLYFVRPIYSNQKQTPKRFEQCVILPSGRIQYALHSNF